MVPVVPAEPEAMDKPEQPESELRRVCFYGGSFDPPHRAHLAIARVARVALALDQVLFAPVGTQPLKPQGGAASYEDRVAMTELAIAGEPGFAVSRIDAPCAATKPVRPRPNYTYPTLQQLRRQLGPGVQLYCLIGADSLATLRQWYRAPELLFQAVFVVAGRPGVALDSPETLAPLLPEGVVCVAHCQAQPIRAATPADPLVTAAHIEYTLRNPLGQQQRLVVLPHLADQTSATTARALLVAGDAAVSALIPPPVLDYIRSHKLYL